MITHPREAPRPDLCSFEDCEQTAVVYSPAIEAWVCSSHSMAGSWNPDMQPPHDGGQDCHICHVRHHDRATAFRRGREDAFAEAAKIADKEATAAIGVSADCPGVDHLEYSHRADTARTIADKIRATAKKD